MKRKLELSINTKMKIKLPSNLRLVKLPPRSEIILFMIREELKNRKLTSGLDNIGFDSSHCSLDMGILILAFMGFDSRPDELFRWYYDTLDIYAEQADPHKNDRLNQLAFDFYIEIEMKKRTGFSRSGIA